VIPMLLALMMSEASLAAAMLDTEATVSVALKLTNVQKAVTTVLQMLLALTLLVHSLALATPDMKATVLIALTSTNV
jgi:hypothetical protein